MAAKAGSTAAADVKSLSSKEALRNLVSALVKVKTLTANSAEAKDHFNSNYKAAFSDLFVKVFVQARDRNELAKIQDELEDAWKNAFGADPFPKVPERKKPLVIFPQTSFEDALALIPQNRDNSANLMTITKYLIGQAKETRPKRIKLSKYESIIGSVLESNPQPALKDLLLKLKEECARILSDAEIDDTTKKAAEERFKGKLKKVEAPNAAQKRALASLEKNATKANGLQKGKPAQNKSPTSVSSTKAHGEKTKALLSQKKPTSSSGSKPEKEKKKKRPMTDAEFEREFLKRARESNIRAELEEERSRRIGAREDAEAVL